jgi:hypothetical protein
MFQMSVFSSYQQVNRPVILKKSAIILTALAISAMIFSSCRTTENCPAYGKVDAPVEQGVNS